MVAGGKASRGEDGMSRIGSCIAFSSSSDVLAILLWCSFAVLIMAMCSRKVLSLYPSDSSSS